MKVFLFSETGESVSITLMHLEMRPFNHGHFTFRSSRHFGLKSVIGVCSLDVYRISFMSFFLSGPLTPVSSE